MRCVRSVPPPTRRIDVETEPHAVRSAPAAIGRTRMKDARNAVDTFLQAAELNRDDPLRKGSLLVFPNYGQVVMTGDLHGHARNFGKIVRYCNLDRTPIRHVILHEIVHASEDASTGLDQSHVVLLDAAKWKIEFPDQVHFLQSNHELAQMTGHEITKAGRSVLKAFEEGLTATYGANAIGEVLEAIYVFIRSLPLAGRTPNRVFLSHSLPNVRDMPKFDPSVVHRPPTDEDLADDGSADLLVWGRRFTPDQLETLAKAFDVDWFLVGHQHIETGHKLVHDRVLILASDHNHGEFLPFDLRKPYTLKDLVRLARPCVSVP